jgi:amino acid adenylation domain-containing protein
MSKHNEHQDKAKSFSDSLNRDKLIDQLSQLSRNEWSVRGRDLSQELCFPELFSLQAKRTPEAVAAVCEGESITYQELQQRVYQLAGTLSAFGVGSESLVALLAERSLTFLTTVLAIWQAGGAYLPLDPNHPPARIHQVFVHSGSTLVLTTNNLMRLLDEALRERSQSEAGLQVLSLEELQEQPGSAADSSVSAAEPGRLAYVIYTSGSTGTPKGVMIEQCGMLNHLYAKISALDLTAADCVAQNASQCFDISVWQFMAALLVGGRVHIFPDDVAHDPLFLLQQVEQEGISILETVPSLLRLLLESIEMGEISPRLERLRWLVPTGEALPPNLCRRWLKRYPHIPLLNAYGPTECSDDVTHYPIAQPLAETHAHTPIGRPIPNMQVYILDQHMLPVPVGTSGELYVGGVGVGRGYLHDAQRTAEAFVTDPFSAEPGARLYKTGDLVYSLPDGNLVFLGRIDHQVKIRGNRIEPGEIETVLAGHPLVQESVVTVREDEPRNQQLVAYLVRSHLPFSTTSPAQESGLETAMAEQWGAIFDEVYSQERVSRQDENINLRVWVSSYTNRPFSEEEIFESVDGSVERILSLRPKAVLEIGCGTGLLLFRVAPHTTYYCGTDISQQALATLGQRIKDHEDLPEVTLLHRAADDFTSIPEGTFDVVILNEVVQYFPNISYLLRTLEGAVSRVRPGGYIFVGGVRNLGLLEAFHLAVQLHQASPSSTVGDLRQRMLHRLSQEKELVIDPDFFFVLQQSFPRISDVLIQLKGGTHRNEFTQFRYDAILRVGAGEPAVIDSPCYDWLELKGSLAALQQVLQETKPEVLGVKQIPNERVFTELKALELLTKFEQEASVDDLRKAARSALGETQVMDPERLRALGHSLSYDVDVTWPVSGAKEYFDAVLRRQGIEAQRGPVAFTLARKSTPARSWDQYAHNPLQNLSSEELVTQVRTLLKEQLPDYMMPSAFVLLEALPLTPNGKLDRRALPAPRRARTKRLSPFVCARTPLEETISTLWSQMLDVEQVSIHDDFIELGGHSIQAMQIISRLRAIFLVDVPLRAFFEAPTIAQHAELIQRLQATSAKSQLPPIRRVSREAYRAPLGQETRDF